ncbi:Wound-induced polypeptide 3 [Hibiscus trionum]|uniref:Wound-induced polypeptide 3 n=1 Tax=Hibiscus trionum TaxID=183268 RepID=A0A9W7LT06_HIBTR|nr:Wound-induced polypeptide 3 [Hibiscus trionum]
MSSTSRAWVAAASIGAVEALKDQGVCRWNYILRSAVQHAKSHLRSVSQAKNNLSSQSSAAISKGLCREAKSKQSEESLRKVMYLSCWGPN